MSKPIVLEDCAICLSFRMGKVSFARPSSKKATREILSSSSKVPEPSDLSDAKVGGSKGISKSDGKIHIYQVPFCDDGAVYWEGFNGPLVSLHLMHEFPNVWFAFLQALDAYCEFRHATDDSFPIHWKDFLESMNMKVVTTSPGKGKKT